MRCPGCIAANRPPKGTPMPQYCDACGFAMTGDRLDPRIKPEAAALTELVEAFERKRASTDPGARQ